MSEAMAALAQIAARQLAELRAELLAVRKERDALREEHRAAMAVLDELLRSLKARQEAPDEA